MHRPCTEGALHDDDVDPAVELASDRGQHADIGKTTRTMRANRRRVMRIANDRQHLAHPERGAALDDCH